MTGRPGRRDRHDEGFVSLVVVTLLTAIILAAGLAYDGGKVLAAKVQAVNEASEAARAGAQALSLSLRDVGHPSLDPAAAAKAAETYLAGAGARGTVSVQGSSVTVRVTAQQAMALLGLAGIGPAHIVESATADAVAGVRQAGA